MKVKSIMNRNKAYYHVINGLIGMHKRVDKFLVYSPFHLIFNELLSVVVLNITFYKISH